MIIFGVDPGTATTGYGVIETTKNGAQKRGRSLGPTKAREDLKCLGYGLIKTSSLDPAPKRLKELNEKLDKLIKTYNPSVLAVENVYFFKNLKTAMPISQQSR
jgi:crossover junction endodeoxyribonuclease RuvC